MPSVSRARGVPVSFKIAYHKTYIKLPRSFSGLTTQEIYDLLPPVYQAGYVTPRANGYNSFLNNLYTAHSRRYQAPTLFPCSSPYLLWVRYLARNLILFARRNTFIFRVQSFRSLPPDSVSRWCIFKLSYAFPTPIVDLTIHDPKVHMAQYLDLSNPGLSHSCSVWLYAGYAARLGHDVGSSLYSSKTTANRRWQIALRAFYAKSKNLEV